MSDPGVTVYPLVDAVPWKTGIGSEVEVLVTTHPLIDLGPNNTVYVIDVRQQYSWEPISGEADLSPGLHLIYVRTAGRRIRYDVVSFLNIKSDPSGVFRPNYYLHSKCARITHPDGRKGILVPVSIFDGSFVHEHLFAAYLDEEVVSLEVFHRDITGEATPEALSGNAHGEVILSWNVGGNI